jgi:hypothetical protein
MALRMLTPVQPRDEANAQPAAANGWERPQNDGSSWRWPALILLLVSLETLTVVGVFLYSVARAFGSYNANTGTAPQDSAYVAVAMASGGVSFALFLVGCVVLFATRHRVAGTLIALAAASLPVLATVAFFALGSAGLWPAEWTVAA